MSLNFVQKTYTVGGSNQNTGTLTFYKKGFNLGMGFQGGSTPSWQDIILSGNTALTLVNSKANGLNYVKLFGACEQRNIPKEYTQVEYLQSSGTQYINTGIVLNSEARITTVGQTLISSVAGGPFSFWGFMGADTMPRWGWSIYQNRWLVDLNTTQTATFASLDTNKHTFINYCYKTASNKLVYNASLDNIIAYESDRVVDTVESYYSNTLTAYLFARNNNNAVGNQLSCKIYSYQIEQNGVLVLNLIPCRRNSDSVLGMYDTVTGNFLTNAGTGTFTAGADVVPTPETPMDIVSNNGALKFGGNILDSLDLGQGTYVSSATNRIYQEFGKLNGKYKITITGNFEFIVQYRNTPRNGSTPTESGNIDTWTAVSGEYVLDNPDYYYGVAIRYPNNTDITPSDFNGTLSLEPLFVYTDGTIETVEAHSKNLFDKNIQPVVGYWQTGGTWSADSNYNSYQYITVKPNTTYTVSIDENIDYWRIALFSNDTFVERKLQQYSNDYTFTTNATTNKLSFAFKNIYSINTFQLEEGSTATAYEPYYYGGSATAEMLLSLGDYKDVQNVLNGSVTRNVGIKVLDGSENWDNSAGAILTDYRVLRNTTFFPSAIPTPQSWFVTHFVTSNSSIYNVANQATRYNGTTLQLLFCISESVLGIDGTATQKQTVDAFKQYLADQYANGTPVIIVYPLEEPTTESVTPQPLSIQAGTNIVEITQASIDNLGLEVSYKGKVGQ